MIASRRCTHTHHSANDTAVCILAMSCPVLYQVLNKQVPVPVAVHEAQVVKYQYQYQLSKYQYKYQYLAIKYKYQY